MFVPEERMIRNLTSVNSCRGAFIWRFIPRYQSLGSLTEGNLVSPFLLATFLVPSCIVLLLIEKFSLHHQAYYGGLDVEDCHRRISDIYPKLGEDCGAPVGHIWRALCQWNNFRRSCLPMVERKTV